MSCRPISKNLLVETGINSFKLLMKENRNIKVQFLKYKSNHYMRNDNPFIWKAKLFKLGLLFIVTSLLLNGCKNQNEHTLVINSVQNGKLIRVDTIAVFDTSRLKYILNEELEHFLKNSTEPFSSFQGKYQTPTNTVTLYKLTYQSSVPEKDNEPTILTGIIALPSVLAAGNPMVSYQHGTVFGKTDVPSFIEESMETKLAVAQFAGSGYIVIAADYHGMGVSTLKNAYLVQKSTEQSCLDLYKAAESFLIQKNIKVGHYFTLGWSVGAYNTLTYLRRLEQEGIPVTATATAAAPSDLNYFIISGILNPRPEDPVWGVACLSNLLFSYENYYGLTGLTANAIRPEYLQTAKDFYEHKIGFPEFFQKTPHVNLDLLTPAFVKEIQLGSGPFFQALNASEGYRWKSITPLRSYFGGKDEVVSAHLAKLVIDYQESLGKKNGELIDAGQKADHRSTFAFTAYHVKPWFDSFLKQ